MGIFSKIFGSDKLELQDDSNDVTNEQKQKDEDTLNNNDQNKDPSPFLMDDEDDKS